MFLKIGIFFTLLAAAHALQCYTCDNIQGGDCDESDHPGELQTCQGDRQAGCFMSQIVTGDTPDTLKTVTVKGCTALDNEDEYKCTVQRAGSHMFTLCNCHGDSCNKDWSSAAGAPVKCYQCNSAATGVYGNCTRTHSGVLEECPIDKRRGCYISQATSGTDAIFERGCTAVTDPAEYDCNDFSSQGQNLHYCNCQGDACNQNWITAGDFATTTSTTTTTTTSTTTTAGAGVAFFSASVVCAGLLAFLM